VNAVFRRALTCAVLLLACVLPLGSAQAALDIRPKDNVAIAQIATDAGHDFEFSWEIRKQRGGIVDHLNSAQAYSQCVECGATAIAFQIVLATDSNTVIPRNEAIAINNECTNCVTVAEARQFVRVYDRRVRITGAGRAFCVGADLKSWSQEYLGNPSGYWKWFGAFKDMHDRLREIGVRAAREDHQPLLRSTLKPVAPLRRRRELRDLARLETREGDRLSHLLTFCACRRRSLPSSPVAARSLRANRAARRP